MSDRDRKIPATFDDLMGAIDLEAKEAYLRAKHSKKKAKAAAKAAEAKKPKTRIVKRQSINRGTDRLLKQVD